MCNDFRIRCSDVYSADRALYRLITSSFLRGAPCTFSHLWLHCFELHRQNNILKAAHVCGDLKSTSSLSLYAQKSYCCPTFFSPCLSGLLVFPRTLSLWVPSVPHYYEFLLRGLFSSHHPLWVRCPYVCTNRMSFQITGGDNSSQS